LKYGVINNFKIIIEFFAGILLLFVFGRFVGNILRLDRMYEEMQKKKDKNLKN
jgi:hypothetical protein